MLAELSRRPVLADPFIYNVGLTYGVVVLAHEAVERRGVADVALAALASAILMDPHRQFVAQFVANAREWVAHHDRFWDDGP